MRKFCLLTTNSDYKIGTYIVPKKRKRKRFEYAIDTGGFMVKHNGDWYYCNEKDFLKNK